jgi:hypothetical protein
VCSATQATDTTITIGAQTPGVTPFIVQLSLMASSTADIKTIQFTIAPKPGSVTRPLSATYSRSYLSQRGYIQGSTIFLQVYGLYDNYRNTVDLTYRFQDGSSSTGRTFITTTAFSDPCHYKNPTILQARNNSRKLSYDYFLIKESCSVFTPTIMDTDGAIRWVGPPGHTGPFDCMLFENAIYRTDGSSIYRVELDGTSVFLHNYANIGVTNFHHNVDLGKFGLICDVDTTTQTEATNIEIDRSGNVLKVWDMAQIISAAMTAGGDDPTQFVRTISDPMNDWFHNNAATYDRASDVVIISSRENFLIALDYRTSAIKWIFGDPTKQWYQFPSLRRFAISSAPGTLPPIGQHAPSITYDNNLMAFDDGFQSATHTPPGANRDYASPRRYQINLGTKVATEVWNYEMNQSINDPICSSVYEDAPSNYLITYSFVGGFGAPTVLAQLLALDSAGQKVFYYQYPEVGCTTAFNSVPLHLENTMFPSVGPQSLNISSRGMIGTGDQQLIAGFIVKGTDNKVIGLRVTGPSLAAYGLSHTVSNPALTVYNSAGHVIGGNDNWQTSAAAPTLSAIGLAPTNRLEAATILNLAPGAYTVAASSTTGGSGIGVVEAFDLSKLTSSNLVNLSTRGFVGTGDNVLISGFIVGDVFSSTVVVRALGPSLAGVLSNTLANPTLTIFDQNGSAIGTNDNWQQGAHATELQRNNLAPSNAAESAVIMRLPAGAYTAIVKGVGDTTGIGLVEIYNLDKL